MWICRRLLSVRYRPFVPSFLVIDGARVTGVAFVARVGSRDPATTIQTCASLTTSMRAHLIAIVDVLSSLDAPSGHIDATQEICSWILPG